MNEENLIPLGQRTKKEQREIQRKGGIASGEARRAKRDMRKLMKMMLDEKSQDEDCTYAEQITKSMLTIAGNSSCGLAAVRAYETILHIIGQDEPEPEQGTVELLKEILAENKKNARLQAEQQAE